MSIYTILQNYKEITQSAKAIYVCIKMNLFKDCEIANLESHRNLVKKLKKRTKSSDYTGRKYEDYLEFIKSSPCSSITEIDTVYNCKKISVYSNSYF